MERAELYQEYIHIQKEVISLLKDADISQPYQALLEQLDKQLQYIHQSFWERRNRSILTSSAMTVLAVAALALTITGVMAPISMTIFAVINIVFCFSALLSWGLAITEEVEFKEDRKNLKQDIKTSNNVATLDLYIKHAEDLENTETKKLSHITQSFFHKTVQEMVLTESPKHVSPGQGV